MKTERLLEVLATQAVEDRCDYCQRDFVWFRPMPPVCPTCGLEQARERITGVKAAAAHDAQERAIAESPNVVEFAQPPALCEGLDLRDMSSGPYVPESHTEPPTKPARASKKGKLKKKGKR